MQPSGKVVYLSEFTGVRAYAIDSASGTLTPMGPVQTVHFEDFDPTGRFAYGTAGSSDSQHIDVRAYSVGADGTLAANGSVQTLPSGYGGASSSVRVAPGGKFAYVVNVYAQTISTYAISPSGTLAVRNTATLAENSYPYGIFFEPGGKMAYVWSGYIYGPDEGVLTYTIDPGTGALTRADALSAFRPNSVTFVSTTD
jgi:6-phosphogluconolactonase (cycloisomerase 2 family)